MNQENNQNVELVSKVLNQFYRNLENSIDVLDICCGAKDQNGTNYDPNGQIYQPLLAQKLAEQGYSVTGLDIRPNTNSDFTPVYTHRTDIDILSENWVEKLDSKWNVLIFLRSWDTPEILLHYQKLLKINDLNLLCLEIAKIYLPYFSDLLIQGGLFVTSNICNFALCEDDFEIQLYKNQIAQLFKINNFELIDQENGLSWYRKTS